MLVLLIVALYFCLDALAVDTVVDVGHTRYRGVASLEGVTSWKGMRYANRPIGKLRFAAPEDPLPDGRILDASKFGPLCIAGGSDLKQAYGGSESEDCLFANVWAPTGAANGQYPVYVFISGGGFNALSNANYDGTSLIKAADKKIVVVNFNYRVSAYGFLASKEMDNGKGAYNAGLLDQRKLLQWVRAQISKFGGDPDKITLGGASAGGGSVVLHMAAHGGRDDRLFSAAAVESQAFPALRSVAETQFLYEELVRQAKCSGQADTLQCLRSLDAVTFQRAHRATWLPFPGTNSTMKPVWAWGPTLDYSFVSDLTYKAIRDGKFVKVPTILGDATSEGTVFTPRKLLINQTSADDFIKANWPTAGPQHFSRLHAQYGRGAQYPSAGAYWSYAADLFGDIRYVCPGLTMADALARAGIPVYQYRWDFKSAKNVALGYGATHVGELSSIWRGGARGSASDSVQRYWASFVRTVGDPNEHRAGGAPAWLKWAGQADGGSWIAFGNTQTFMQAQDQKSKDKCALVEQMGEAFRQ